MKQFAIRAGLLGGFALLLMGASCSGGTASKVIDGGIYKSIDAGTTWSQKVAVPEVGGKVLGFPNAEITDIAFDPNDHNAVYISTKAGGMLYTYDGGDRWYQVKYFGNALVNQVAVDYNDKCRYVVALPGKISRTTDCGRTFKDVLIETRPDYKIKFILTDHFNKNVLYAANTKEVVKSLDYGESWMTVGRFKQNINSFIMDSKDSRVLLVGLQGGGVQRSLDGAKSWVDLIEEIGVIDGGRNVSEIVQNASKTGSFIAVADAGLLRTDDNGSTWQSIQLLTPPKSVKILSLAIDPKNGNNIYYTTATTLYKSDDGGKTWTASKPPTAREIRSLVIDPKDSKVMYLGSQLPPK